MELVNDAYHTASMLVDTVQLNLMHIGSKPIEFLLNVDEHVPSFLIGDELRIKQIMNNILSNAFKYTDEGTVKLDVRVNCENKKQTLVFCVSDTGQGMSKEQLQNLFEIEFTRFNLQSNKVIEGSGLGMNIAYHLINMMGGTIRVDSEVGVGTTFTVCIPQVQSGEELLGRETIESLQNIETAQRALKRLSRLANIHMPYGKVLVVDDVESNLYVAKGLLMPYKLTIETVNTGRAAVHKVRNGNIYDIIFMDHMMPGMDGIEATKKIRELGYTHPIVALTANTVLGQSELFLKNGFSGFISKPIDVNQLNTYLLRMIRDKQPPEILAAAARDQEIEQKAGGYADDINPTTGEVSVRLKESFIRDAKRSSEAIHAVITREYMDVDAFKIYIIHAHAMKSALHNVGEPILSSVAGSLEQAGREGDTETILALTSGFLKRLDEVVANTSKSLAASAKKNSKKKKAEEDSLTPTEKTQELLASEKIIFVVDDSDTNLILAEEALDDSYKIFTILSAHKMFEMLSKIKPNLILLDIEMPDMDGFEAMEKIKAEPTLNSIPVVFLTATVTPEIAARAKQLGAADIFAKPFTAEGLRGKVEGWLSKPGAKPTILIIDDTPMVISTLSRMLLPLYSVKAAKDGREGLDIANRHTVDLILLDIKMPGFSGFEVLESLKKHDKTRGIPVIFITGSDEIEDEALGFSMGAVDYIVKPFIEEKVLHRVGLHIQGGKIQ
jgi:CheY-like chemotaxis protein/two-component sensor histidine kinase